MTFEDKLKQKADESRFLSLSNLSDEITATVIGEPEWKKDKRGNECLYIVLDTKEGTIVQKFGKSIYETLYQAIQKCGGLGNLKIVKHTWRKSIAGKAINPRYYPIPNPKTKA